MNCDQKYEEMLKAKILGLCSETSAKVFLFGSRAKGTHMRNADYDIGIEQIDSKSFQRIRLQFEDYLEESIIPYKVDLIHFDKAESEFQLEAKRRIVIWKDV